MIPTIDPSLIYAMQPIAGGAGRNQGFGGQNFGQPNPQAPAPQPTTGLSGLEGLQRPDPIPPDLISRAYGIPAKFDAAAQAKGHLDYLRKRALADSSKHYGEYGGWARAISDSIQNAVMMKAQLDPNGAARKGAQDSADAANKAAQDLAPDLINYGRGQDVPQGTASMATQGSYQGPGMGVLKPPGGGGYQWDPNLMPFSLPG